MGGGNENRMGGASERSMGSASEKTMGGASETRTAACGAWQGAVRRGAVGRRRVAGAGKRGGARGGDTHEWHARGARGEARTDRTPPPLLPTGCGRPRTSRSAEDEGDLGVASEVDDDHEEG